jgi:aldehyde:ferredoxin oxidoreductase
LYSYSGRCLVIDLTDRKAVVEELPQSILEDYLGGVGLGTRLLMERVKPGIEPLGPDNPLIFASSGLTGTMAPASAGHAVVTCSPLTGFLGDSVSYGNWSLSLKGAGYDAVVITGVSSSPVYIFIDDDVVHFLKADHLLGRGAPQTAQAIRREIGDDRVRVASIGPSGERLVRYACINNDTHRQAGRTGCGAVMGSKNLKAIAVRGTRPVSVDDLGKLQEACAELCARSQTACREDYRALGTANNVLLLDRVCALPTRNFQQASFERAEDISGEHLAEHYLVKVTACPTCPIACEHVYRVKEGTFAGLEMSLDYATLSALGPLCGIDSAPAILKAAELCDYYGMDAISTGNGIAWAMECFQKGLLTKNDTDGLELSFGNADALVEIIHMIGRRNGLGDLLAEGVKRASAQLGQGSEHWAMHSKGMELPGYDPRSMKTQALAFAVGLRGGCRNRSSSYELDMVSVLDEISPAGWGALSMEQEDLAAVFDSLIICKSMRGSFHDFLREAAYLYALATGIEIDAGGLRRAGERINNLKKVFNISQGWTRADDSLPPRLLTDPIPDGEAKGVLLTEQALAVFIDDYYLARGWTNEGHVPVRKLDELGMDDVVEIIRGY